MSRISQLFWSFYSAVYDAIWDSPVTERIAEAVGANLPEGASILDFGCGTGLICRRLTARGHPVVALDPSGAMLRRARSRKCAGEFILSEEPPTGKEFDSVIVVNVLHLADSPAIVLERLFGLTNGPIVVVWPEDDVNLLDLAGWEREGGKSIAWILRALVYRILIGIPGVLLRIRTAEEETLRGIAIQAGERASRVIDFTPISETGCLMVIFTKQLAGAP